MARLAGVDLPKNKRVEIALTYVFGVGRPRARQICKEAGFSNALRTDAMTDADIAKIREIMDANQWKVEGDLRREVGGNIKRLMDIGCFRGLRHKKGLPVRGQRTKTNARTKRGAKKTMGTGRKIADKK